MKRTHTCRRQMWVLFWRREWDSNPRWVSPSLVFKTSSLNRSDISPCGTMIPLRGGNVKGKLCLFVRLVEPAIIFHIVLVQVHEIAHLFFQALDKYFFKYYYSATISTCSSTLRRKLRVEHYRILKIAQTAAGASSGATLYRGPATGAARRLVQPLRRRNFRQALPCLQGGAGA